jgi:hypothetical protein
MYAFRVLSKLLASAFPQQTRELDRSVRDHPAGHLIVPVLAVPDPAMN